MLIGLILIGLILNGLVVLRQLGLVELYWLILIGTLTLVDLYFLGMTRVYDLS